MRMEGKPRETYQPWRSREPRPERFGLSWKQIAMLVALNALIALGISVAVTLTLGRTPAAPAAPTLTATPPAAVTPQVSAPTAAQATTYSVKAGDSLSVDQVIVEFA